jgi:hypothetical protein
MKETKIDWVKLREKFFDECTEENKDRGTDTQTQIRRVNLLPHDLFEWFKRNIQTARKI